MNAYEQFGTCYDRMMHDVDYSKWAAYLDRLMTRYADGKVRTVLDAACGTGTVTLLLAGLGYDMIALDRSVSMLDAASAKARAAGLTIPFLQQDLCNIRLHHPVDAIVSVCDGVNYLLDGHALTAFLQSAHAALNPDGLLLFDVSSAYKLQHLIGDGTFTELTDAYGYIWQNAFDGKRRLAQMQLTCFVKNGARYDRFDETHVQRAYSAQELTNACAGAGFYVLGCYDAFSDQPPRRTSERLQFVCQRKD